MKLLGLQRNEQNILEKEFLIWMLRDWHIYVKITLYNSIETIGILILKLCRCKKTFLEKKKMGKFFDRNPA